MRTKTNFILKAKQKNFLFVIIKRKKKQTDKQKECYTPSEQLQNPIAEKGYNVPLCKYIHDRSLSLLERQAFKKSGGVYEPKPPLVVK